MNVFLWHVHGSWTTALVQGDHCYYVPVDRDRSPWGRGRARTWTWPAAAVEVTETEAAELDVDVVLLQRPEELHGLAAHWLGGRRPAVNVPAVYVEHNAPQGRINEMVHPTADVPGVTVVHVTPFNELFWDCGERRTRVIEHGVVDPGDLYTGELARLAVVVNEPARRGRVTGTDLLPRFAAAAPVDLFGIGPGELGGSRIFRKRPSTRRWPNGAPMCTLSGGPRSGSPCSRRCTSGCPCSRWRRPRSRARSHRVPASSRRRSTYRGCGPATDRRPRRGPRASSRCAATEGRANLFPVAT